MIPSAGCLVFSCLVSNLCLHSSCYYITKFSIQFHTFITLHNTHHIHSFYTTQHDFALCASTLLCFISTSLFTSLHFILFYFILLFAYGISLSSDIGVLRSNFYAIVTFGISIVWRPALPGDMSWRNSYNSSLLNSTLLIFTFLLLPSVYLLAV